MNKNKQNSDLIKEKLYKILPLERNERLKEILHLLNLTNKEEVEISKNKIFDAIISIPKEGQAPKIPIFGIITLENSDPENIKKIRKFLWNKNDIPLSLIITPTDIILNNNYNIKETKGFLNSLDFLFIC